MNNKCVYIYLDHRKSGNYIFDDLKFDFEPIYVGKGNPDRPYGHKYSLHKKTRFYSKYNKILKETNIPPKLIIIKTNLSQDDANKMETDIIKRIGRIENGGTLTNLTDGGDHNGGFKVDKSLIEKRLQTLKNNQLYLEKRKIDFIEKSKLIHRNLYDYSLVSYEKSKLKVKIICLIHGIFEQTPDSHLNGRGCPKCGGNHKINKDDFIKKSQLIHENKYDYSLIEFTNQSKKIKIICPIHGKFEQIPRQHLIGRGCPKCGIIKSTMNRTNQIKKIN